MGADGRLLRQESKPSAPRHPAGQGNHRTPARLSHRHGRRASRPELETIAQSSNSGEPAGHQQDTARLRRAVARRERPADRGGDGGNEVAMMRWLAGMVLAAFALAASVHAQENVPEPDGYRTD